jgi:hypothetical protein
VIQSSASSGDKRLETCDRQVSSLFRVVRMAEHVSNSEYVGIDARSSYVSTEHDASNREALYTIFPETVPKSAKVSDFVYYYYNPWDPNYLVYLVYDCSEEDFEVECQRLRQIDSSARYAYYGVTGFPYKLEAVLANAYYGFTYCLSDADNHRLIYVQIYHCNYFSDIDYTRYIAKDHLPLGYDATGEMSIGNTCCPPPPTGRKFQEVRNIV